MYIVKMLYNFLTIYIQDKIDLPITMDNATCTHKDINPLEPKPSLFAIPAYPLFEKNLSLTFIIQIKLKHTNIYYLFV